MQIAQFAEIVRRHQAGVCAVAYGVTGDRAPSEDIAQDTFLAAWRGARRCAIRRGCAAGGDLPGRGRARCSGPAAPRQPRRRGPDRARHRTRILGNALSPINLCGMVAILAGLALVFRASPGRGPRPPHGAAEP